MAESIRKLTVGDRAIEYHLMRSARRRRTVEVTVDSRAEVRVAAPTRLPVRSIEEFLVRRSAWVLRHLDQQALRTKLLPSEYRTGSTVPFLGQRLFLLLREKAGAVGVRPLLGTLEVSVPPDGNAAQQSRVVGALERWYRGEAEAELRARVSRYASMMEVAPPSVLVRSQKHLWGSCSPRGVLRFNWKLIMAPPTVVDYVVVHELCHLRHPHHQKPFWDAVAGVLPDYRARRAELRRDGGSYTL